MDQPERQRIDKWLFFARIAKSRTLAGKFAAAGNVRVNREKIDQASFLVKPGDVLTITLERRILVLKILGCGQRRGPAPEAQLLYEDITPKPAAVDEPKVFTPQREPGAGRPTKRDRRKIDQFRNPDEDA
ncbi:MAG: RNA-binding S4 domain-containing protein [Hoeflea sp.]|uniref:RNA-binding S4 domain-containing protein n=1 Tax=Hoeflea sp. TaxID=1940281 RepID=UPI001D1BF30C|nr:RNA-binding S4 domain-containing protein [Hoeflea sp.]MBU4528569.1 RNA-binding S4 domain-containing protein [Alphaproteobacteria bacterium]MBU4545626.1 RNA-binding S4 domain-containing protein [Alphaproteobacteria bacterium]MBU4552236.1 RNA-binding S4 domain-containing protein [Alphaproteobacteria bacterium]MBV1726172.1 RNA-binding S4 domain-containing protein [Hoeflea sp.]MBV1762401.1 RNA-binding S4 domain-containing protein [Hoeflea sp.]